MPISIPSPGEVQLHIPMRRWMVSGETGKPRPTRLALCLSLPSGLSASSAFVFSKCGADGLTARADAVGALAAVLCLALLAINAAVYSARWNADLETRDPEIRDRDTRLSPLGLVLISFILAAVSGMDLDDRAETTWNVALCLLLLALAANNSVHRALRIH